MARTVRKSGVKQVPLSEIKDDLSRFLREAETQEIVITRHGRQVARLVPPRLGIGRDEARAAVQRIRERAEQLKLGRFDWSEWKAFRDEGRP